jgi:hypothetical protein
VGFAALRARDAPGVSQVVDGTLAHFTVNHEFWRRSRPGAQAQSCERCTRRCIPCLASGLFWSRFVSSIQRRRPARNRRGQVRRFTGARSTASRHSQIDPAANARAHTNRSRRLSAPIRRRPSLSPLRHRRSDPGRSEAPYARPLRLGRQGGRRNANAFRRRCATFGRECVLATAPKRAND